MIPFILSTVVTVHNAARFGAAEMRVATTNVPIVGKNTDPAITLDKMWIIGCPLHQLMFDINGN
jgi:hypothetical protein